MNVSYTDVQTAVLMSDYVWKGLYEAKQNGILELTDSEIRKRTDLTRWMNIGLDKAFILEKSRWQRSFKRYSNLSYPFDFRRWMK